MMLADAVQPGESETNSDAEADPKEEGFKSTCTSHDSPVASWRPRHASVAMTKELRTSHRTAVAKGPDAPGPFQVTVKVGLPASKQDPGTPSHAYPKSKDVGVSVNETPLRQPDSALPASAAPGPASSGGPCAVEHAVPRAAMPRTMSVFRLRNSAPKALYARPLKDPSLHPMATSGWQVGRFRLLQPSGEPASTPASRRIPVPPSDVWS